MAWVSFRFNYLTQKWSYSFPLNTHIRCCQYRIVEIRLPYDRLISNMGFSIMVRHAQINRIYFPQFTYFLTHMDVIYCEYNSLCQVTTYGEIVLCLHWFRQWLRAWRNQIITRTNVDFSSVRSSTMHQRVNLYISHQIHQLSITKFGLKSLKWLKWHLKFHSNPQVD